MGRCATDRKMGRQGQMAFGESLMVVIILVFILGLGMVFYYNASKASLDKESAYREDIGAVMVAKRVLSMPEVRCGAYEGSCTDKLKLEALAGMLHPSTGTPNAAIFSYYSDLFEYATIRVHYVERNGPEDIILYNDRPDVAADDPPLIESRQFIFTTIYDPVSETQELAYLNVTRYTRRIT